MKANLATVEASFRLWAFHTAYAAGGEELNPTKRFAMALALSARPVDDRIIEGWAEVRRVIKALNRQPRFKDWHRRRCLDYWQPIYAAIREHFGLEVRLRAWEIDRLQEIDVGPVEKSEDLT